ncbi:MAG: YqaE/Pmp3 family membrane protein [Lentisphaeria bacterium]|nr:YqaE/Pmp3 family membrane protein [Lentisphaeria bacterium]
MGTQYNSTELIIRVLLAILFPPLAVFDKGCGSMLLVFLFTVFGWLPGTILAVLLCMRDQQKFEN